MKTPLLYCLISAAGSLGLLSACWAAPGDLDPSFGGTGVVTTLMGTSDAEARGVAVQPDGKIVVAGFAKDGEYGIALARYKTDGELDSTFGNAGKVLTPISGSTVARGIALQPDGKIVVAGSVDNSAKIAVVRYDADGSLDPFFGPYPPGDPRNTGKVTTSLAAGDSQANAVVVQPDGKIVVVGQAGFKYAVVRYKEGGEVDSSFNGNGLVLGQPSQISDTAYGVALQNHDGKLKIVVTGSGTGVSPGQGQTVITKFRLNPDGSGDGTFTSGSIGIGTAIYGAGVAVQGDGNVVLAGYSAGNSAGDPNNGHFYAARFTANGQFDPGFASGATVIGAGKDAAAAVALQSDDRAVLVGYAYNVNTDLNDFALVRYDASGNLDPSFHEDGKVTTIIGDGHASAESVAIQSDGKIVVAGYSAVGGRKVFTVARYFGTDQPPAVHTGSASFGKTTAMLTGTVNPNSLATTAYFEYGLDTNYGNVTSVQACGSGVQSVPLSAGVGLLQPNTTYHYRLVATNSAALNNGKTEGADATFTTDPDPPQAFASNPTGVNDTSARLNGVVLPNGRATEVYFDYGMPPGYQFTTPVQVIPASNDLVNVSADVAGLDPGKIYQFRVVARHVGDTLPPSLSEALSFVAKPPPPIVVSLGDANGLTADVAAVSGVVNPQGADTVAIFEYSEDAAFSDKEPQTATPDPARGTDGIAVSTSLTGLKQGTTYFYRLTASSAGGNAVPSAAKSFTTLELPVVSALGTAAVETTSAQMRATIDPRGLATSVIFYFGKNEKSMNQSVPMPGTMNTAQEVTASMTGLEPETSYVFQVLATSAAGDTKQLSLPFTTPPIADVGVPIVTPRVRAASFAGTVNPRGTPKDVVFEYGEDPQKLDRFVAADPPRLNGSSESQVEAAVSGLGEAKTYYVRLRATNVGGGASKAGTLSAPFQPRTNTPPTALPDDIFLVSQVVFEPLRNDTDDDEGDAAQLRIVYPLGPPLDPAPVPNVDIPRGQAVVSGDGQRFTYTVEGANERTQLKYRARDPQGGLSAPATVRLISLQPYAGTYGQRTGLAGTQSLQAVISLDNTGTGVFTGTYALFDVAGQSRGSPQGIRGAFGATGRVQRDFAEPSSLYKATFDLQLSPDEKRITGTLRLADKATDAEVAVLPLDLPHVQKNLRPGLSTAYLVQRDASGEIPFTTTTGRVIGGDGYLVVAVNARGGVTVSGRMPDGEPFKTKATAIADGDAYAFIPRKPYRNQGGPGGVIDGTLAFLDVVSDDDEEDEDPAPPLLTGRIEWTRNAGKPGTLYAEGITAVAQIEGREYPATAKSALPPIGPVGATSFAAKLSLTGGNLPNPSPFLDLPLLFGSGQVTPPANVQFKASAKTGTFTGSFTHPVTNRKTKFTGAFRAPFDSANGSARGLFLGQDESGSVRVVVE